MLGFGPEGFSPQHWLNISRRSELPLAVHSDLRSAALSKFWVVLRCCLEYNAEGSPSSWRVRLKSGSYCNDPKHHIPTGSCWEPSPTFEVDNERVENGGTFHPPTKYLHGELFMFFGICTEPFEPIYQLSRFCGICASVCFYISILITGYWYLDLPSVVRTEGHLEWAIAIILWPGLAWKVDRHLRLEQCEVVLASRDERLSQNSTKNRIFQCGTKKTDGQDHSYLQHDSRTLLVKLRHLTLTLNMIKLLHWERVFFCLAFRIVWNLHMASWPRVGSATIHGWLRGYNVDENLQVASSRVQFQEEVAQKVNVF